MLLRLREFLHDHESPVMGPLRHETVVLFLKR